MKNLPVDSNSRTIQCAHIGFTKNFSTGVVDKEVTGYVRLKNIGEEDAMVWYFPPRKRNTSICRRTDSLKLYKGRLT